MLLIKIWRPCQFNVELQESGKFGLYSLAEIYPFVCTVLFCLLVRASIKYGKSDRDYAFVCTVLFCLLVRAWSDRYIKFGKSDTA